MISRKENKKTNKKNPSDEVTVGILTQPEVVTIKQADFSSVRLNSQQGLVFAIEIMKIYFQATDSTYILTSPGLFRQAFSKRVD